MPAYAPLPPVNDGATALDYATGGYRPPPAAAPAGASPSLAALFGSSPLDRAATAPWQVAQPAGSLPADAVQPVPPSNPAQVASIGTVPAAGEQTPPAVSAILAQHDPSWDASLPVILRHESANQDVPNYRYDPRHTAGGYLQITDTNWHTYAPKLGIDTQKYPTAMSAPREFQLAVGKLMHREQGIAPWDVAHGGSIPETETGAHDIMRGMSEAAAKAGRELHATTQADIDRLNGLATDYARQAAAEPPGSAERDRLLDQQLQASTAAAKAFEDLSKHPPTYTPLDVMQRFGSRATVIAAFGGLLSRQPITAALNAAGTAMEALNQQNYTLYERSFDTWKTQTQMAVEAIKAHSEVINEILTNKRLDWDERQARLQAAYTQFGMTAQLDALKRGDVMAPYQMQVSLGKSLAELQKMQMAIDAMHERYQATVDRGWEVLQDPSNLDANGNPTPYNYNKITHRSTTLDGKPYQPHAAGKLSSAPQMAPPTQADVDFWANVLRNGGSLPPGLSRTSAGSKLVQQVMHRMAEMGGPQAQIANVATVKADESSLRNMTRMADAATSFERTAKENFDLALRESKGAIPTNWGPWINRWVENGETGAGNPNVPAYVAALLTAANEYAKIMSGSTGAQGSTVDSRREAAELFSPYLNQGQIDRVVSIAETDMANRKKSLYGQIDDIKSRLRQAGSTAPTESLMGGQGGGAAKYTVGQIIILPNGKKYRVTGGDLNGDPDVEPVP